MSYYLNINVSISIVTLLTFTEFKDQNENFPAAVNFTRLYHVLHSVVNCHSASSADWFLFWWMFDSRVWDWHARLYFNYFWMWLRSWFGSVSLAQRCILTLAVGMQSEAVSCREVGGQRVYTDSNTKDTQKCSWRWCGQSSTDSWTENQNTLITCIL